jgi:hypothetical protein
MVLIRDFASSTSCRNPFLSFIDASVLPSRRRHHTRHFAKRHGTRAP